MNINKLHGIKKVTALIYGDFMIDKYINGDVSRISPEAPIPVIKVTDEKRKLGGAGNVVNNVVALGAQARIIGCSGEDENGVWLKQKLNDIGADTTFFRLSSTLSTIIKTRIVSKNQQFIRCDKETIEEYPQEITDYFNSHITEILDGIDVIIISDYAKGAVNEFIAQLLINNGKNIPVVIDPKGSDYSKYKNATVCTPNMNELAVVSNCQLEKEEDIFLQAKSICKKINIENLLITRSEKGMSLVTLKSDHKIDFPAIAKDVIDVTGAGDTVVTAIALLLAIGFTLEECCPIANIAASNVVSKFGPSTTTLNEIISNMLNTQEFKNITCETAKYIVADLKEKGKKVVFTNGCFDLLHAGHISSFKKAKGFGNKLIVAVNSDASVKRIKGESRPIIDEKNRIAMLCAIECIDYVILMDDDDPSNIIREIKPDICIKGEDWKDKSLPEAEVIKSVGAETKFISLKDGLSTTKIIDSIIKVYGKQV